MCDTAKSHSESQTSSGGCDRCLEGLGKATAKIGVEGVGVVSRRPLITVQLQVAVLGAILFLAVVACFAMHARQAGVTTRYISLKVDQSRIARCHEEHHLMRRSSFTKLPCISSKRNLLVTSNQALGPLSCVESDQAECSRSWFRLTPDGNGVVIPEDGIYRVHSQVTFLDDSSTKFLTSSVRVDTRGSIGSDGTSGIWLDCASHGAHPSSVNPFVVCTLDGVRRLRRGHVISFTVRKPQRVVNLQSVATGFFVYRL